MASLVTHPIIPFSIGVAFGRKNIPLRALFLGMILSMLPDADVIAFRFGIPYEHMLGHRGISHSLLFAGGIALLCTALPSFRGMRLRLFAFFAFATASHGFLDAMTTGGKGVGFFIPFEAERYFLPLRPILVSPLSVKGFFTERGWAIFKSELLWIWLPCAATALAIFIFRRREVRA
jgi:inner membrane protein